MIQYVFTFTGRINRKPYWIITLFIILTWFVCAALAVVLTDQGISGPLLWSVLALLAIPLLLSVVAYLSISMRRLHDRNKGWGWYIALILVPLIVSLFVGLGVLEEYGLVDIASYLPGLYALIELGFMRGTSGGNQYGPDPLSGDVVDNRAFD